MSNQTLEQRIASLEKEVSELKAQVANHPSFEVIRDASIDIFLEVIKVQRKLWGRSNQMKARKSN